jgi:hypothetical protein
MQGVMDHLDQGVSCLPTVESDLRQILGNFEAKDHPKGFTFVLKRFCKFVNRRIEVDFFVPRALIVGKNGLCQDVSALPFVEVRQVSEAGFDVPSHYCVRGRLAGIRTPVLQL